MQLSKTQISALLTEIASQEDGFNEILRMSFEAMMKAERLEHFSRYYLDLSQIFTKFVTKK